MEPTYTIEPNNHVWETVSDGITRTFLRSEPGEMPELIRIGAGKTYPHHTHAVPDEVFVVDGVYADPGVEAGAPSGPAVTCATRRGPSTGQPALALHHSRLKRREP